MPVKCLYDQVRCLTKPSVISDEKKHLSPGLVSNSYPSSFMQKLTRTRKAAPQERACDRVWFQECQNLFTAAHHNKAFTPSSSTTWHLNKSHLVRLKDNINPAKQDSVVYRIPYKCSKSLQMVKQKDLRRRGSKSMTGIYDLSTPKSPLFLSTPIRPATTSLLIETHSGTPIWSRRRST